MLTACVIGLYDEELTPDLKAPTSSKVASTSELPSLTSTLFKGGTCLLLHLVRNVCYSSYMQSKCGQITKSLVYMSCPPTIDPKSDSEPECDAWQTLAWQDNVPKESSLG